MSPALAWPGGELSFSPDTTRLVAKRCPDCSVYADDQSPSSSSPVRWSTQWLWPSCWHPSGCSSWWYSPWPFTFRQSTLGVNARSVPCLLLSLEFRPCCLVPSSLFSLVRRIWSTPASRTSLSSLYRLDKTLVHSHIQFPHNCNSWSIVPAQSVSDSTKM